MTRINISYSFNRCKSVAVGRCFPFGGSADASFQKFIAVVCDCVDVKNPDGNSFDLSITKCFWQEIILNFWFFNGFFKVKAVRGCLKFLNSEYCTGVFEASGGHLVSSNL